MGNIMTMQLEKLSQLRHESPAMVIAEALEIGIAELFRESVLKRYIRGDLSKKKAVQLAGLHTVKLAEQQHNAVLKDIAWGLKNETSSTISCY